MSELYHTVKCRLCPKAFEAPPMKVPESVSEPVDARTANFVSALAQHMAKKHSQEFDKILLISRGVIGNEILKAFEIEDEGILRRSENLRHQMFKLFQTRIVLDEELRGLIKAVALHDAGYELSKAEAEILFKVCAGIRDFLTERDQPSDAPVAATPLTQ